MAGRVEVSSERMADFSRRHNVAELALFGSALREDFGSKSDLDILISFKPGTRVSLFDLVDMADELSTLFGRRVDLTTERRT